MKRLTYGAAYAPIIGDASPLTGKFMANDAKDENVDSKNDADDADDTGADETDDSDTGADAGEGEGNADELDPEALKAENETLRKRNLKLFERTKKAEGFTKDPKTSKWVKKEKPTEQAESAQDQKDDLSSEDLYTLIQAKVPKEDIKIVREYAKLNKVTIDKALESAVVKSILAEKAEERQTADVTNTGPARRGTSKTDPQALIDKANETGELPEKQEDVTAMVEKRFTRKKQQ
jgi:hypothetical protein